jgi:argininosuccinate synthase
MVSILAYGGGVNSTAMIVGMIERGERADAVVFADTGGELPLGRANRRSPPPTSSRPRTGS